MTSTDRDWMLQALLLAERAAEEQEVPVGAVLVAQNRVLGQGWNQPIKKQDPTAHAEIIALREGAKHLGNYRLPGTTLYVTLEPCAMCVGAMLQARIQRLVFAALDSRAGAVCSMFRLLDEERLNHRILWEEGLLSERSIALLQTFFQARRR